jgi:hypothetical protein
MSHHPAPLRLPAASSSVGLGGAAAVSCWLCGIHTPTDRMVADGGSACDDVRWYCQDTRSCTRRWTTRSAGPADVAIPAAQPSGMRNDESAALGIFRATPT